MNFILNPSAHISENEPWTEFVLQLALARKHRHVRQVVRSTSSTHLRHLALGGVNRN